MRLPADPAPEITLQSDVPLPAGITAGRIESLVSHILEEEGVSGPWMLGLHFVDDDTMQAAHVEFMGIDEPTDIMTFPYETDDDELFMGGVTQEASSTAGGDLLISVDRAAENAAAARWQTEDELLFLVAHGMLHLLGWDDDGDDARQAMLERQQTLISAWLASPQASE